MNKLTGTSVVLAGLLGAGGCLSLVLAACGTNAVGEPTDAGPDTGPDHIVGMDVRHADSPISRDTGHVDAGHDSGTDAGHDSGTDAGHDGGRDSGRDTGPDTGVDAAEGVAFLRTVVQAYCQKLSECCVGDAGSHFELTNCVNDLYDTLDTPLTNLGPLIGTGYNSPNHAFDPGQASICLEGIAALSCSSNANTTLNTLVTKCTSAYVPLLTADAGGCQTNFDCPQGTFCGPMSLKNGAPAVQGGTGTCTPLKTIGEPCVDTVYSTDCNYLASEVNVAFCNAAADGGVPRCATPQINGSNCSATEYCEQCQSGQCFTPVTGTPSCVTMVPFEVLYGTNYCAPALDGGGGGYVCPSGCQSLAPSWASSGCTTVTTSMPGALYRNVRTLVLGADVGLRHLALAAVIRCLERVGLTVATLLVSTRGQAWALPVAIGLGCVYVFRAAARSTLRLRVRARLIATVATALLRDKHLGTDTASGETETSLVSGVHAADDVLSQRVPDLMGDVPACVALTVVLLQLEPRVLVLEGGLAVIGGAAAVLLVRRFTAASAQQVWETLAPAMDDFSTAIHGRLELVGNGDDASFLSELARKLAHWESRSRGAARVSFLAGRAPIVAAVLVVALLLLGRGNWRDTGFASVAVIASVTPAFAGVGRGTLDLVRDLVFAGPVLGWLEGATRAEAPRGTVSATCPGVITWIDVSFSYPDRATPALDRVSVTWSPGELLGLGGQNGSGKSTFLRLLLALYPPTGGTVLLASRPLMELDGPAYRRRIAFLTQRPFLPDHMTVGRAIHLLAPDATASASEMMLARLALWPALVRHNAAAPLEVKLGALSAGEKQRVAIARVLLRDADLLILDEPDANLDSQGILLVADLLRQESQKRMVIFAAHDSVLLARADRVIRFDAGRVDSLA